VSDVVLFFILVFDWVVVVAFTAEPFVGILVIGFVLDVSLGARCADTSLSAPPLRSPALTDGSAMCRLRRHAGVPVE
jgi:hypothetical protein